RMMNECEPGGPSPELARAYTHGSLLAGMASAKRLGEAAYRRAVEIVEGHGSDADRAWVLARVAVFRLSFAEWDPAAAAATRAGGSSAAFESVMRAAALIRSTAPVAYWMLLAITQTLEVLFGFLEDDRTQEQRRRLVEEIQGILRAARRYARMFPIGRPEALLASGSLAWHLGRRRAAMTRWRRAAAVAARLRMPYELGSAHA